jgi:flagellar export protein FliJ
MAFAFRLARVLHVRTQLRRQAQDEAARARSALAAAREAVAAARAVQEATRQAETVAAGAGMTGGDLLRFRAYEAAVRAREDVLAQESARLAEVLVRSREVLIARRRQERQLELLRERARDRAEEAEERAAMALLDDLALRRRGGGR